MAAVLLCWVLQTCIFGYSSISFGWPLLPDAALCYRNFLGLETLAASLTWSRLTNVEIEVLFKTANHSSQFAHTFHSWLVTKWIQLCMPNKSPTQSHGKPMQLVVWRPNQWQGQNWKRHRPLSSTVTGVTVLLCWILQTCIFFGDSSTFVGEPLLPGATLC